MKTRILLVAAALGLAAIAALGGDRSPVVAEFTFSPALCRQIAAGDATLHFQLMVLRLNKGEVYFVEGGRIPVRKNAAAQVGGRYRHQVMLEKGDYLLEYLWYSTDLNRFELLARNIAIDKVPNRESISLAFTLDDLSQDQFKKYKRSLVYSAQRGDKPFLDHMLWLSIRRFSLRPAEEQAALFTRLKTLSAYINYAPANSGRGLGMSRDAATLQGVNGYIVAETYFKIAVRADNLQALVGGWSAGASNSSPRDADTLRQVSKEARQIVSDGRMVGLPSASNHAADEEPANDPAAQREALAGLAESLEAAVRDTFFNAERTVSLDQYVNPIDLAERMDVLAQGALKTASR